MTWQADLGNLFAEALGGDDLPEPDLGFVPNLERYVAQAGSGRKAAKVLGVPESTLRGWRHGVAPRHIHQRQVELVQSARKAFVPRGPLLDAWNGTNVLAIKARVKVSGDVRTRILHPGREIPQATTQRLIRMYLAGADDTQLGKAIASAIDRYYQKFQYLRVDGVWFE